MVVSASDRASATLEAVSLRKRPVPKGCRDGSGSVMRIAVIHSFYTSHNPSGENNVVETQVRGLREAGHDVTLIEQRTDERAKSQGLPHPGSVDSGGRGPDPLGRLWEFGPDVVHVHNLFPNWGTDWLHRWKGPVVVTLHNFRPLCAAGTLYRGGTVCTECPDGDRWAGIRHGCYRGSRVSTFPLAWRNRGGVQRDRLINRADKIIALSARAAGVYQSYGVPASSISIVPNFADDPYGPKNLLPGNGRWIYAGRLSPEKGVLEMLSHWPDNQALDIIGDGPLSSEVRAVVPSNVRLLGALPREHLLARLPEYTGLVIPSRWYEGAPLIVPEALAAGVPIVALSGNGVADTVTDLGVGVVVDGDDQWSSKLNAVAADPELRQQARRAFDREFTRGSWLDRMWSLYTSCMAEGSESN